ncbi:hypothetical protein LTR81_027898, partial [Elasticomyces elasticus]
KRHRECELCGSSCVADEKHRCLDDEDMTTVLSVLKVAGVNERQLLGEPDAFTSMPNGKTASLVKFGKTLAERPHVTEMDSTSIPTGFSLAKAFIQGEAVKDQEAHQMTAETEKLADSTYMMHLLADVTYAGGPLLINVPLPRMGMEDAMYRTVAVPIISRLHDEAASKIHLHTCEANIIPRLGPVPVHHDGSHGISTLRSVEPRPEYHANRPIKLWFFWPSSKPNMEALRAYYNDRDTAVYDRLEDGVFIVQTDGETMSVPAGVIHATFTLRPSILLGMTYSLENAQCLHRSIETFHAELNADQHSASKGTPHERFVELLEHVLEHGSVSKEVARAWNHTVATLEAAFSGFPELWARIREAWRPYIKRNGCSLCQDFPMGSKVPEVLTAHVYYHIRDLSSIEPPKKKDRT